MLACLVGEPDAFQQRETALLRGRARHLVHVTQGEGDVLEHREVREEVVALEHRAEPRTDPVRIDPGVGDVLAAEQDLPVVDRLEQVEAAQQGGLARPARTDHGDHLVGRDLDRDAPQHRPVPE